MTYFKPTLALLVFAAAGAVTGGALPAWGQTATEAGTETATLTPAEKFLTIDLDSNGLVSEAEFVAYATDAHDASRADASAKFAQIAGDDGVITLSEFEAVHTASHENEDAKGS